MANKISLLTGYKYNSEEGDYMKILYFTNVTNSKEILDAIINQTIPQCAVVDGSLVCSP